MKVRGLIIVLLTLFLPASLAAAPKSKKSPQTLVFTNVNVVELRGNSITRNVTVVVKNGRIDGVGKVGLIAQGPGITLINADGRYLIPGLWDMHAHSAFADSLWDENIIYPLFIANGVTGIRDMGGDPGLLRQRRDHIERGDVLGPHMVMAGPFLSAGKSNAETIAVNTPEDARHAVDTLKMSGVDFIKILSVPREAYFALAEESKKQKLTFAGHVSYSVSALEASTAGQHSIEHLSGILLACSSQEDDIRQKRLDAAAHRNYAAYTALGQQVIATYDPAKAKNLFRKLAVNSTWQVPTFIWTETNANLDNPNLATDSRLKYVPASVRRQWVPAKLLKNTSAEVAKLQKTEAARDVDLVRDMHASGVPFLAGTDGPDPFIFPGFSLHDELEWLVKCGFTPAQALRAATLDAATFLRKVDTKLQKTGAIDRGYPADFVLLDANPLEDIRNTRKISAVILGGEYYSRADLDKILAQVENLAKAR